MKLVIISSTKEINKSILTTLVGKHEVIVLNSKNIDEISDHHDADGIILHVNDADLFYVLGKIPVFFPILIQSSVSPDQVDRLYRLYSSHSIVISPEFARMDNANYDFSMQTYFVLGGEDPEGFWHDLIHSVVKNCKMVFSCSDKEAAIIGHATKCYADIKAAFFAQLADYYGKDDINFDIVRQILTHDPKIGQYSPRDNAENISLNSFINFYIGK